LLTGLNYPDIPRASEYKPNIFDAKARKIAYNQLMRADGSINLANEIVNLENDLTVIFNK